jgi:hypothetical protein
MTAISSAVNIVETKIPADVVGELVSRTRNRPATDNLLNKIMNDIFDKTRKWFRP